MTPESEIRVVYVEDDERLARLTTQYLASHKIDVHLVTRGDQAVAEVLRVRPDVVLLDLMLPGTDGIEICRQLRARCHVPIIMVTARTEEADRVIGLEGGADDYVAKPFQSRELLARIRVALRRVDVNPAPGLVLTFGPIAIDRDRRRVAKGDEEIRLTPKEFDLLLFLAQHAGRVLTHKAILKAIWGPHAVDQPEHLRVLIGSLRKKIETDPARPRFIVTEPWVGYRFETE